MANGGWFATKEDWERVERPLIDIDPIVNEFARETGMSVTKNLKDWPERSIRWITDGIDCLIQIYLEDAKLLTFNLWLCAAWDSADKRYWKQEFLVKEKCVSEFRDSLSRLLREGEARLIQWAQNPRTFEVAAELKH